LDIALNVCSTISATRRSRKVFAARSTAALAGADQLDHFVHVLRHGELLKLGFEVAQSSVAKYMVRQHRPPSQGWRTFLLNQTPDIAAIGYDFR
jgi:hypothetical protein